MMKKVVNKLLDNVTRYDDFEEFSHYNGGITREDWDEYINDGWGVELTPGVYNGATNKFTGVSELTGADIVAAINHDIMDDEFIDKMMADAHRDAMTPEQRALCYSQFYNVYTIGARLFVDKD